MGLDIRLPMGLLFVTLGLLLGGFGLLSDPGLYARSLGHNVNLGWGMALLLFGAVCLFLGRRRTSAMHPADATPEGRATEEREQRLGLEREPRHEGRL
jgi:hypothetical protein